MPNLYQAILVACVVGAVLAFGGTDPLFFAAVEVATLLLFLALLWAKRAEHFFLNLPWKGPVVLLAYVAIQSFVLNSPSSEGIEQSVKLLTYVCVFLLTVHTARDQTARQRLVTAILLLALFEALYGLAQYLSGWQYIFAYEKSFYTDRATGTYINPNHFAGFLEMVLPLAFAGILHRLGSVGSARTAVNRTEKVFLAGEGAARSSLLFFVALLIFIGILCSHSRMGIFSATASLLAIAVLWASSSWRWPVAMRLTAAFLLAASLFVLWIGLGPLVERYEGVEGAYLARLGIWQDSWSLIKANPLFGTGLGSFVHVYPRVQSTFLTHVVDHAHNDYLEITAELGILGAGLLFGLIVYVLGKGMAAFLRLPQSRDRFLVLGASGSVLAILLHSFSDFNLYIPANAMVLAFILGLLYSASASGSTSTRA